MEKTHVEQFWRSIGHLQLAVEHWHELDSTNDRARALCHEISHPVLVTAAHQRAGRGRHGNVWHDVPGAALLMSVGIPTPLPPHEPAPTVVVLATAACAVLTELVRLVRPDCVRLKYPNDVWVKPSNAPAGKVGGMLIETDYVGAEPGVCVVGIGINLQGAPMLGDAAYPARCLADVAVAPLPPPEELAERIAERLLSDLLHNQPQTLMQRWQEELRLLGHRVVLRSDAVPAVVVAYGDDGSLRARRCDTDAAITLRDADSLLYDPFAA